MKPGEPKKKGDQLWPINGTAWVVLHPANIGDVYTVFEVPYRRKIEPATGIESIVCADIAARQRAGIAKYGMTVKDNPLSLREWLQHAYEECLDQAVYLRRAIDEL